MGAAELERVYRRERFRVSHESSLGAAATPVNRVSVLVLYWVQVFHRLRCEEGGMNLHSIWITGSGYWSQNQVIARALRDAGMEVVYTGLRQTPEMIVNAALQEDVQVIGLSILSGAHNAIVPRVMELLKELQMSDVLVIVGGIVPDEDAAQLKRIGVAQVYQPGASLDTIVNFIRSSVKQTA